MAMTKAEREKMANLERARDLARALRWPDYPEPTPSSRVGKGYDKSRENLAYGYFANEHTPHVTRGCRSSINHCIEGDKSFSQGLGRMFDTEEEAWRWIRLRQTEKFAEILARTDAEIRNSIGEG